MANKLIMPRELRLNVTDKCNLECFCCSKDGDKDKEGKPLSLDEYLRIIDEWAPYDEAKSLSITGGEPLFEKEYTYAIIKRAKKYGILVRLCTNGHFIEEKVADDLADLGVDEVQIGLDSSTPEFHNRRCNDNSYAWQRAVSGIEASVKRGLYTTVRYTLYKSNLDEVVPTYKFVSRLGVAKFKLRMLFPVGAAIMNGVDENITGEELAIAQNSALDYSRRTKTKLEISQPYFLVKYHHDSCNVIYEDNSSCGERNNASINSKGNVEYCLFCDDGARFGNVRDASFLELWNTPAIKTAREERRPEGEGCPALGCVMKNEDYASFMSSLQYTTRLLHQQTPP